MRKRDGRWDRLRVGLPLAGVLALPGLAGLRLTAGAAPQPPAPRFDTGIRPLVKKYCFGCHGPTVKQAELDLSRFTTEASLAAKPEVWRDVLGQLRSHAMPPEKAPQPTEAERRLLTGWLERTLAAIDARAPRDPGRSPLRRLNRTEYNRTVRDLIGLDLRPADDFPADDTAHGFDNVAEGLSLSPLLLERYLDAAEKILDQALVTDGSLELLHEKLQAEALPRARAAGEWADLPLEQELGTRLETPSAGEYAVRVRARQQGAGDEPATLVLKVDGVDSHVWSLTGEEPAELEARVPLGAGTRQLSLRHTWHMALPDGKRPPEVHLFVDYLEVTGPARVAAHRRIFFAEPGLGAPDREAARAVVHRFAARAFRRPVETAELGRFLALYDRARRAGRPHPEAVRLVLLSVLVSPQFLFHLERGTPGPSPAATAAQPVGDYELASRLSYFLWSSMPDEELFRLAAQKRLRDPQVLEAQVRRMLRDPRADALAESFAAQWLGLRRLESAAPDPQLFPAFKPGLRQAMLAEPLLVFRTVIREDRSLLDFLDADWTFLNEDLARHYGIRGVTGGYMRRVSLTDPVRGGVVTMGAVLTATSHPTRTSAVKRGKWVLEEILGSPPPPPPPDVPELEVPAKGQPPAAALRERLERHRADPRCSGCHVRMDTLGLGLENYDAVGRWREREGQNPIDASGTLPGGERFAGPAELKKVLAGHRKEFARCLAEKLFVYALGRGLQPSDRRELDRITAAAERDDYRFTTLLTAITRSYPFLHRRGP